VKIYVYPTHALNDATELVAVSEHDDVVAMATRPDTDEQHAVNDFADFLSRTVPDARLAWVAEPYAHPELAAIIDRLSGPPPDDAPELQAGESLCLSCAHASVCAVASAAHPLAAVISTCEHHLLDFH
jgi:hypothetical protein